MHGWVTTALDVLGLLLVAAGLVFFLWPWIGGGALAAGGGLVLAASALSDTPLRVRRRQRKPAGTV